MCRLSLIARRSRVRWLILSVGVAACCPSLSAGERSPAAEQVSFERHVRPILRTHCFHCHGELEKPSGGLDLRLRRLIVAGGKSGPAIAPGDVAASYLLQRIRDGEMPPGKEGHLSGDEVATIEHWIAAGAPTLRPEPATIEPGLRITEEDRSFWSFKPIRDHAPPAVSSSDRVRTPIDAFLLSSLEDVGLSFSADADRRTMIRRAYFDLLGLPPSPDEVDAFVADRRPNAYERLIDRLLNSPAYGERWGRHWLDVAGYADSEGYNEADTLRPYAYRYRDYVIRSLNADKPFNQFVREQLAGDEMVAPPHKNLSADDIEKLTATGFLRMAPDGTGSRNDDPQQTRNAVVTETVKIVSSALLGLTVGCAECHDHRYDPILQKDFYRLRAVFEPALHPKRWLTPRERQVSLLTEDERELATRLERQAKAVEAELQPKLEEFRTWVFEKELDQVPTDVRQEARAAGLAWQADPKSLSPEQAELLEQYPGLKVSVNSSRLNLFLQKYGRADELQAVVKEHKTRAAAVRAEKPVEEFLRVLSEPAGHAPETYLFERGDPTQLGEAVGPGELRVLSEAPIDYPYDAPGMPTTGRRSALAQRLTDLSHPLTARVLVNRIWIHHFGRGLVATPGDFGSQGEPPTHPELLDYLAKCLMRDGWSLKALHRLIMTSTAYRQDSKRHALGDELDRDNKLYWRMAVRRLEAEAIRDAILAASGELNPAMYGRPVPVSVDDSGQAVINSEDGGKARRSVYIQVRRTAPIDLLEVFDAPQMEPNCERRNVSTVAPQSLLLMNSQFVVEQAESFARRVADQVGTDRAAQAREVWRRAFSAEPTDAQLAELVTYLETQSELMHHGETKKRSGSLQDADHMALASLCQVLVQSNRFLYVD